MGPNFVGTLDTLARHTAYVVSESLRRAVDPARVAVEPSVEAEEAWAAEVLKYDRFSKPLSICTPGYYNSEGETQRAVSEEEEFKRRRNSTYMRGLPAFREVLAGWRADGKMDGLVLRC